MKALIHVPRHGLGPHEMEMAMTPEFRALCEQEVITDIELRHFRETPQHLIRRVLEQKNFARARINDGGAHLSGWAQKYLLAAAAQPPPKPPPVPPPKPKAKRPRKPKAKPTEPKKTIAPSSYRPRRILS